MGGKAEFLATMENLFTELDRDGNGQIKLAELQEHIADPKVNAFFRAIDLNVWKVKRFFQLMDMDGSGDIDRREFVQGCTRLKGEAKELDIAIPQFELKQQALEMISLKTL